MDDKEKLSKIAALAREHSCSTRSCGHAKHVLARSILAIIEDPTINATTCPECGCNVIIVTEDGVEVLTGHTSAKGLGPCRGTGIRASLAREKAAKPLTGPERTALLREMDDGY